MKVSVIMPSYNAKETIKETVGSVLGQSMNDLEIMIIDDGSTDNSVKNIESLSDDRIKLIKQKNSGSPAGPRNVGIKESAGEFVALCDQDDLWYPEKLKKQTEAYEKSSQKEKIGIVICSADIIDESGAKIGQNIMPDGFISPKESFERLLMGDFITACSAVVPRKVLNEMGPFDEKLKGVDDYDLWLRITQKYGILSISEPLCAWRSNPKSLSAIKSSSYLETEKVFEKLAVENQEVKIGHGKNLMRIFVALVLEGKKKEAKEIMSKIKNYPISQKAKIILGFFGTSYTLGVLVIRCMDKSGLISL